MSSGQSNSPQTLQPGERLRDYKIIELLGRGGMGEVYLADHVRLARKVALKVLPESMSADASFIDGFDREAKTLARLEHPNIVSVTDSGLDKGRFYLVMEYVEGGDLRDYVQNRMPLGLNPTEVRRIFRQILDGMAYAHKKDVVHRDLKPANIMLTRDGRIKISDFGLAQVLGDDYMKSMIERSMSARNIMEMATIVDSASGKRRTTSSSYVGTPEWMSPEAKEGRPITKSSDIFALGLILFYLFKGRTPIGMDKPLSQSIKGASRRWDKIVNQCLQPLPEDRFRSVEEIVRELEKTGGGANRRWIYISAAALVLAASSVLVLPPAFSWLKDVFIDARPFAGEDLDSLVETASKHLEKGRYDKALEAIEKASNLIVPSDPRSSDVFLLSYNIHEAWKEHLLNTMQANLEAGDFEALAATWEEASALSASKLNFESGTLSPYEAALDNYNNAQSFFNRAQEAIEQQDFTSAQVLLANARTGFEQIGLKWRLDQIDSIERSLAQRLQMREQVISLLEQAEQRLASQEFSKGKAALDEAQKMAFSREDLALQDKVMKQRNRFFDAWSGMINQKLESLYQQKNYSQLSSEYRETLNLLHNKDIHVDMTNMGKYEKATRLYHGATSQLQLGQRNLELQEWDLAESNLRGAAMQFRELGLEQMQREAEGLLQQVGQQVSAGRQIDALLAEASEFLKQRNYPRAYEKLASAQTYLGNASNLSQRTKLDRFNNKLTEAWKEQLLAELAAGLKQKEFDTLRQTWQVATNLADQGKLDFSASELDPYETAIKRFNEAEAALQSARSFQNRGQLAQASASATKAAGLYGKLGLDSKEHESQELRASIDRLQSSAKQIDSLLGQVEAALAQNDFPTAYDILQQVGNLGAKAQQGRVFTLRHNLNQAWKSSIKAEMKQLLDQRNYAQLAEKVAAASALQDNGKIQWDDREIERYTSVVEYFTNARLLRQQGLAELRQNNWVSARAALEKALNLYNGLGLADQSEEIRRQLSQIDDSIQRTQNCDTLIEDARNLLAQQKYPAAWEALQQAASLAQTETTRDRLPTIDSLRGSVSTAWRQSVVGTLDSALESRNYPLLSKHLIDIKPLLDQGTLDLDEKDLMPYLAAHRQYRTAGNLMAGARENLGQGDLENARKQFEEARELFTQLGLSEQTREIDQAIAQIESEKAQREAYREQFQTAASYYDNGQFKQAIISLDEATGQANQVGDSNILRQAQELRNRIVEDWTRQIIGTLETARQNQDFDALDNILKETDHHAASGLLKINATLISPYRSYHNDFAEGLEALEKARNRVKSGNYDEAADAYRQALSVLDNAGITRFDNDIQSELLTVSDLQRQQETILLLLGKTEQLIQKHNYEEARSMLAQAAEQVTGQTNLELRNRIEELRNAIATDWKDYILGKMDDAARARDYFSLHAAVEEARQFGGASLLEEELARFERMLSIAREAGNALSAARSSRDSGQLEEARNQFKLAREHYAKINDLHIIDEIDRELQQLDQDAAARTNVASLLDEANQKVSQKSFRAALDKIESAQKLALNLRDIDLRNKVDTTRKALAIEWKKQLLGDLDQALKANDFDKLRDALADAEERQIKGFPHISADELNRYQIAIRHFVSGQNALRQGSIALDRNQWDTAIKDLEEAVAIFTQIGLISKAEEAREKLENAKRSKKANNPAAEILTQLEVARGTIDDQLKKFPNRKFSPKHAASWKQYLDELEKNNRQIIASNKILQKKIDELREHIDRNTVSVLNPF